MPARHAPRMRNPARGISSPAWDAAPSAGRVTDADLRPLLAFYRSGREERDFDFGIEKALRALLVSPDFLFRIEQDPARRAPGSVYRISDLELASRLSFFLWSSIPDDELLDLAEKGKLKDPAVLDAAGTPAAGRSARRSRWSRISPASGCICAIWRNRSRIRTSSPSSTKACGRASSRRPSCSSRTSCAKTAA